MARSFLSHGVGQGSLLSLTRQGVALFIVIESAALLVGRQAARIFANPLAEAVKKSGPETWRSRTPARAVIAQSGMIASDVNVFQVSSALIVIRVCAGLST